MRARLTPMEAEVVHAYRTHGLGAAVHTRVRALTCPFDRVAAVLPERGSILDLGCGHGLLSNLLARQRPERVITGVDHDLAKIEVAQSVADQLGTGVRFLEGGEDVPGAGTWDAIVVVDVLYLLGRERAAALLRAAAKAVRPGGTLVVKEIAFRPRWKYLIAVAQERLATGPLGITRGADVAPLDPVSIVQAMRGAGLTVEEDTSIHRWYPHPHHLVVGRAAD